MNLREFFTKKPVVRPESPKEVKSVVVTVDFPEWIETLKRDYANATIRVKRSKKFIGETPAYVGDPIQVSNIEPAIFDRVLYELFGGGMFGLEYWEGNRRIMLKNSKPQRAVTHTINVEGEPKQLGGRKAAAAQSAAQPKTLVGLLLKQFDTPEGIASVTAFATVAMNAVKGFMSGQNQSGGLKEVVETMGEIFRMMPAPPDPIEELERVKKLQVIFGGNNRPPVNIRGGAGSVWDGLGKVLGEVLGAAIANAQGAGAQKEAIGQSPPGQAILTQGQVADPLAETTPGLQAAKVPPASASPTPSPTPEVRLVNAKIVAIQAAIEANIHPLPIADDIWSLLIFLIDNGMADDMFIQSLYAEPHKAFDQIITLYAPQSANYAKLDEVKKIVVNYILEDAQLEAENEPLPDDISVQPEPEQPLTEESQSRDNIEVVDIRKPATEAGAQGSEEPTSPADPTIQTAREQPVVITAED